MLERRVEFCASIASVVESGADLLITTSSESSGVGDSAENCQACPKKREILPQLFLVLPWLSLAVPEPAFLQVSPLLLLADLTLLHLEGWEVQETPVRYSSQLQRSPDGFRYVVSRVRSGWFEPGIEQGRAEASGKSSPSLLILPGADEHSGRPEVWT